MVIPILQTATPVGSLAYMDTAATWNRAKVDGHLTGGRRVDSRQAGAAAAAGDLTRNAQGGI